MPKEPLQPAESDTLSPERIDAFVANWQGKDGGERANYQLFVFELCELLDLPTPRPASSDNTRNEYVFERSLEMDRADADPTRGYIDCYKRDCFVLETKQGVEKKERAALSQIGREREAKRRKGHGVRGSSSWDATLVKARNQAERYARALPTYEGRPPFLIVADVGHCIELYAEFSRSGGVYTPFPDARSHRFYLDDLRRPEVRARLRAIWTEPLSLDPARRTADVTCEVAGRLAALAKSFEASGHEPRFAAEFLMRCIFTMFAEDVELLPRHSFREFLEDQRGQLHVFPAMLESLWRAMDRGEFCAAAPFAKKLLRFNGGLFRQPQALAVNEDQLELLIEAARADWREVEPAIFGTLLERALDLQERHTLGAHYTPRAYVERLVLPTVIEPLRADWETVETAALHLAEEGKDDKAREEVERFHRALCAVRVLDPACGSGNFLYVTLEHMKRLEGEVLDTLERLGGNRRLEMDSATVRPAQMLGIEINPRAAVIAELVLWIGYLQWHLRATGDVGSISEPVLEDAGNIEARDAVLAYDRREMRVDEAGRPLTVWDGRSTRPDPATGWAVPDESARVPLYDYLAPHPATWPTADFIVGNPPFIGASRMRDALGDGYVDALRRTLKAVPESADLVMYWWQHAADLVAKGKVRRFGFVTTNSIRQTFNRRVVEAQLGASKPISLIFAIPDHPWVEDVTAADVRVAMTVGEAGEHTGELKTVREEVPGDESFLVRFKTEQGKIYANLAVGVDLSAAVPLQANAKISSRGVQLIGSGFIVEPAEAETLGLGRIPGIERHIRDYRNGKDLTAKPRGVKVIDLFGLDAEEVSERYPELFQRLYERVKPERDQNKRASYREKWWIHGEPRSAFRPALDGLSRYIATVETSKHRFFQFLDASVLPDNMLVNIASDDALHLGLLSSEIHVTWALAMGGRLGVGNDPRYNKTRCFETFPFPDCTEAQAGCIRQLAESLDARRKARIETHPELSMTGIYNVLEKLRAKEALTDKEKQIHEKALTSLLLETHKRLDKAVYEAYGWEDIHAAWEGLKRYDFYDFENGGFARIFFESNEAVTRGVRRAESNIRQETLRRLVELNRKRGEEEKRGHIRWLRPAYQAAGSRGQESGQQTEFTGTATAPEKAGTRPPFPKNLPEQIAALRRALATADAPTDVPTLAKQFKNARKDRIRAILESLQALGHASETKDGWVAG